MKKILIVSVVIFLIQNNSFAYYYDLGAERIRADLERKEEQIWRQQQLELQRQQMMQQQQFNNQMLQMQRQQLQQMNNYRRNNFISPFYSF